MHTWSLIFLSKESELVRSTNFLMIILGNFHPYLEVFIAFFSNNLGI